MKKLLFLLLFPLFADAQPFWAEQSVKDTAHVTPYKRPKHTILGPNVYFYSGFENKANGFGVQVATKNPTAISYPTSPKRAGNNAVRFELNKTDWQNFGWQRSEVLRHSETTPEQWLGFSEYMQDWASDPQPEIIFQWHGTPDLQLGEVSCSPPVCIYVQNNHYVVWLKTSPRAVNATSSGQGFAFQKSFDLGPVIVGRWVDWVFHIRWDWHNNGVMEVWKDKIKVINYVNGPTYCNDLQYPYFKIGIYKWPWMTTTGRAASPASRRVLYVDEIKFANKYGSFAEVSPTGGAPDPTPTPDPTPAPDTIPSPIDTTTQPIDTTSTPTYDEAKDAAVRSFTLVNTTTNKDVMTIADGSVISKAKFPYINIRANIRQDITVASITFKLSGAAATTRNEAVAPYSLFGDTNGKYTAWVPVVGKYTLTAYPVTKNVAGKSFSVTFTVTK